MLLGALLGAIVGSFLATLAIRWPLGRSVVVGRSSCDHCGKGLPPWSLVPIVSFVVQRGRCRRCGAAIDRRHPALEIAAATIGLLALALRPGWPGLMGALFGWMLLTLAVLDVTLLWLPDRLTLPLLGLGLAVGAAGAPPPLADRLMGAAAGYALLAGIALAYARLRKRMGMGGGDPKLLAAIGGWLGWHALPLVVLAASVAGLCAALLLRAIGRRVDATSQLPFGAFLALAAWPAWLLGGT